MQKQIFNKVHTLQVNLCVLSTKRKLLYSERKRTKIEKKITAQMKFEIVCEKSQIIYCMITPYNVIKYEIL
jgi:hypothetical protein